MHSKVLIDTNVVIDVIDANRPCHAEAIGLFERQDVEICVIVTSLKDSYYILNRIYRDEARARDDVKTIMQATTILDITAADAWEAIASDEPDFEDGLVRSVAETSRVDVLITRDAEAFGACRIPKMTAAEFLSR